MEILLIACMLAWAAGSQNEQSKLGLSPAQRAIMREQTRHEKAIRRIAEKHGGSPEVPAASATPKSNVPTTDRPAPAAQPGPVVVTVPEAFRSAYRGHTPLHRVATPMGRRAGTWAAQGVSWAQDTGRGAMRAYRKRRRAAGHDDPAPVFVPMPPSEPPLVPPMPTEPPTVGADGGESNGVSLKRPDERKPAEDEKPDAATEVKPAGVEKTADEVTEAKPADTAAPPVDAEKAPAETEKPPAQPAADKTPTTPAAPEAAGDTSPKPSEPAAAETTEEQIATTPGGVGRMAAEVTYESVADESDELSIMCEDDTRICDRIRDRAEREIGRGDTLMAQMEATGFGSKVISWVARCKENYGVIHSEMDDLKANTIAQGEKVVQAKALLEAGQGVYADIAKDMESVADRDAYISDAVDAEDTQAHTEVYETKAVA